MVFYVADIAITIKTYTNAHYVGQWGGDLTYYLLNLIKLSS